MLMLVPSGRAPAGAVTVSLAEPELAVTVVELEPDAVSVVGVPKAEAGMVALAGGGAAGLVGGASPLEDGGVAAAETVRVNDHAPAPAGVSVSLSVPLTVYSPAGRADAV
jgi:hypothetical protein